MTNLIIIERQMANVRYAMFVYKANGKRLKYLKYRIKYWWLERRKRKYERKSL